MTVDAPKPDTRCGFVALIGAPNAGKSTLMNLLVGAKVSIVSRKVQTTRTLVRGIAIEGDAQIIFVDTPGLFRPARRLDRAMVTSAWGGAVEADAVALLVDASKGRHRRGRSSILSRLGELRSPKFLVLNKIDLVLREKASCACAGHQCAAAVHGHVHDSRAERRRNGYVADKARWRS